MPNNASESTSDASVKDASAKEVSAKQALAKKLIRDISCDPINVDAQSFMMACDRASFWNSKAEALSTNNEQLKNAIQEAVGLIIKTSPKAGLCFDLQMIENVGQKLEIAGPEVRTEFSRFVSEISEHYCNVMEALPKLGINTNEVTKTAKEITNGMHTVAHEVEHWGREIANVAGIVAKLPFPKEVKEFIQKVGLTSTDVSNIATQVKDVVDKLWQNTEQSVTYCDALNDEAKRLREELENHKEKKDDIEPKLKAIETKLAAEQSSLNKTLGNIKAGFQAASIIAGVFGQSQLANDIIAVGEAGITIVENVALLIAGSAASGPAMPIIAIAGAIGMLASHLFGGGKSQNDQIILSSINKLSKHIDERFKRVEAMLIKSTEFLAEHIDNRINALNERIDNRFNKIEETLKYMYKDMLFGFSKLHAHQTDKLTAILQKVEELRNSIDYLHTDMATGFKELFEQQGYEKYKEQVLNRVTLKILTEEKCMKYYVRIVNWIKNNSKSNVLTGDKETDNSGDNEIDNLVKRVKASDSNLYINKLRQRAIDLAKGDINAESLVNPIVWADGVRTLVAFFALKPELYEMVRLDNLENARDTLPDNIDKIKNEGNRIVNFIHDVQQSEKLFENLIFNYKNALLNVINKIYETCVTPDTENLIGVASSSIKRALMRVTAIEVCDSFIEREIYPENYLMPDLGKLDSIVALKHIDYPFPGSAILKEIAQQFAARLADSMAYHGGVGSASYREGHDAYKGNITAGFDWALQNRANQNAVVHHWDNIKSSYKKTHDEAQALREAGEDFRNFIHDSHSEQLRTDLNYRNKRISAILSHYAVIEKAKLAEKSELPHLALMTKYFSIKDRKNLNKILQENKELKGLLENLQESYDELSIFISFAFPKQFVGDPQLRVFLETLWDMHDVLAYIAPSANKTDFIAITLQKLLDPGREIDCFKRYIFTMIASAKLAVKSPTNDSSNLYNHPLMEKILNELNTFEQVAQLAIQVPKDAPKVTRVHHSLGYYDEIEKGEDTLFVAIQHQLNKQSVKNCTIADLKNIAGSVGTDDDKIQRLAIAKNIRITIIDTSDGLKIKGWNSSGANAIHLLYTEEKSWHPFYPNDTCKARVDYRAVGLINADQEAKDEIARLKKQITVLETMITELNAIGVNNQSVVSSVEAEHSSIVGLTTQGIWAKPSV